MNRRYQAVIFDMDGVLADSEPIYNAAMQSVLAPLGIEVTQEHQLAVMGSSIEDTWRYFAEAFDIESSLDRLIEEYDRELRRKLAEVHETLPGVRELIAELKQRRIPLGVATSSIREWIDALLGGLGLQDAFDVAVSGREVAHPKPAPDIYLLAAQRLDVEASRCIAIEDTPRGLASAGAAGMLAVQVCSSSTAFPPLPEADLVLDSLRDFDLALLAEAV